MPQRAGIPVPTILRRPPSIPRSEYLPLPVEPPNRPLGVDPVMDLGQGIAALLGLKDPFDPAASIATQLGAIGGSLLPVAAMARIGGVGRVGRVARGTSPMVRSGVPIRAYHGSPHHFDKFRISQIGTGEGAQAYGHGLYFAERQPVARYYRPKPEKVVSGGSMMSNYGGGAPSEIRQALMRGDRDAAIAEANRLIQLRDTIDTQVDDVRKGLGPLAKYASNDDLYNPAWFAAHSEYRDSPVGAARAAAERAIDKALGIKVQYNYGNVTRHLPDGRAYRVLERTGGTVRYKPHPGARKKKSTTIKVTRNAATGETFDEAISRRTEEIRREAVRGWLGDNADAYINQFVEGATDPDNMRVLSATRDAEWYKGTPESTKKTNVPRLRPKRYYENVIRKINADPTIGQVHHTPGGAMYEVELDVRPDQLLDWDAKLPNQSPGVLKAVLGDETAEKVARWKKMKDGPARQRLSSEIAQEAPIPRDKPWMDVTGGSVYREMAHRRGGTPGERASKAAQAAVSEQLAQKGVPGIRYFDAFSRHREQGTSNFVIFDEGVISILRKFGLLLPLGGGVAASQLAAPGPGPNQ